MKTANENQQHSFNYHHPNETQEPALSISLEEISLIIEGIEKLPIDRTKTVVFDRLMMKLGKVESYWKRVERAREIRKTQLAQEMLKKEK